MDNLPVVPKEKYEKLEGVVRKIYSQIGVIKEDGLWMPVDPDTEKTLGYCFIEYNTPQVPYFHLPFLVQVIECIFSTALILNWISLLVMLMYCQLKIKSYFYKHYD